ncbi:DUF1236 domain-containing protein [Sinorhizobium garamanticum]|uniref:DUF1236 domain-containing protein n=1 Tax=Sinorhizobium garamanticum TaxID=680247 RepID=A0ABY8D8D2_9HYPH|nr:DUF1236 domain-containing protein [Sinorhizobium garamanticum]WEX87150.1 DUF1236 domain-containing protein [Sinorhizobium garamanticum]
MKGILIKSAIALSLGVTYVPALAQTEQPAQGQSTECPAGTECPQGGAQGQQPDTQGAPAQPEGEGTEQPGQPMEEPQPDAEQGGTGQQPQPDTGTPEQQQQDQVAPEAEQPTQPDTEQQPPEGQTDQQQPDQGQTEQQPDQGQTEQPQGETGQDESQQGQTTGGDVNVTVEQKTEITQIIKEENVEPVDVDINVTVGAAVPETVELRPLPPRIVKIVPQYEGYRFFVLADGRIVIVEPSSLKIVVILA